MDIFKIADNEQGLSNDEIAKLLEQSLEGRTLKNVLVIPPDFTRFHSNAGFITQVYYKLLTERGVQVDILPALGTHVPVSETQWKTMFGDIPYSKMIVHNWRTDVVKLGEVPADAVKEISGEEIESVGFRAADYDETAAKYDPHKLRCGYNVVDGEEVYFIPNPALGLWINRETFGETN